jgi:cytochrome c oxidase assembly factor CtaG
MQLHFLAVGSLFFWVLIGVDPNPRRWHPLARMGLLLAAMPFHAFFSIAIMSTSTVLDAAYFRTLDRPYSVDLLADQHLGGGIGWALSEVPVLLVAAAIFVQWARADHREAIRLDRTADRAEARLARSESSTDAGAESDEFTRYNAYLSALAHRQSGDRDR